DALLQRGEAEAGAAPGVDDGVAATQRQCVDDHAAVPLEGGGAAVVLHGVAGVGGRCSGHGHTSGVGREGWSRHNCVAEPSILVGPHRRRNRRSVRPQAAVLVVGTTGRVTPAHAWRSPSAKPAGAARNTPWAPSISTTTAPGTAAASLRWRCGATTRSSRVMSTAVGTPPPPIPRWEL